MLGNKHKMCGKRYKAEEVMTATEFNDILDFIEASGYSSLVSVHYWANYYKERYESCAFELQEVLHKSGNLQRDKKSLVNRYELACAILTLIALAGWITAIFR